MYKIIDNFFIMNFNFNWYNLGKKKLYIMQTHVELIIEDGVKTF